MTSGTRGGLALFFLALLLAPGCALDRGERRRLETWTESRTGMEFVLVPAGELTLGSPADEPLREAQEVAHRVRISRPYYLGRTEVTQGQWVAVMGSNPSRFAGCGADCPVESVSRLDIEEFLRRFEELTGERFRLPTEAEWERACRAGTTTAFATGATLTLEQANFDGTDPYPGAPAGPGRGGPMPVGSFPPNGWGLFDLHGNVWEWTADRHCPYPEAVLSIDPVGLCASPLLVIRGGSWHFGADSARCALRYTHRPQDSGFSLGFRLVWEPRGGASG